MLALSAAATVVFTAVQVRPVFISRTRAATVVLPPTVRTDSADPANVAPWLTVPVELALKTDRFRRDREAFALDLIRTGQVNPIRARGLAEVAVSEAYRQRIPPALVLGVMLTENDEFKSQARSKVGAVGLMQVYGRAWRGLATRYGKDLHDDATNIRYGIHILRWNTEQVPDTLDKDLGWRKALLGYNGCVRGTNTPGCRSYPEVVRRNVQRAARASCGRLDFESCVVDPLYIAMKE